jgi:hypothetical protein
MDVRLGSHLVVRLDEPLTARQTGADLTGALARLALPAAVAAAFLTVAWVVLLLVSPAPPADADAAQRLQFIGAHDGWQIASFLVVVPLALLLVPVWLGLAALCWRTRPAAGLLALAFGVIYAPLSTSAYWAQLTTVRGLAELQRTAPGDAVAAFRVLGFADDRWSLAYAVDVLGYAILGLAALAIGYGLAGRRGGLSRVTAALFGATGVLALLGAAGFVAGSGLLELGVLASGGIFLLALIGATLLLYRAGWSQTTAVLEATTG